MDVSFLDQLQHLQQLLLKKQEAANEATQSSVKFDKKLLDFDYGEEEDDDVQVATSPKMNQSIMSQHNAVASATNNLESLGLLLTNPEVGKFFNY
jgi:RNA-binding protein 16